MEVEDVSEFRACDVKTTLTSSATHDIELKEVRIPKNEYFGTVEALMSYCKQCGDSYVFGSDGKWHLVELGAAWTNDIRS